MVSVFWLFNHFQSFSSNFPRHNYDWKLQRGTPLVGVMGTWLKPLLKHPPLARLNHSAVFLCFLYGLFSVIGLRRGIAWGKRSHDFNSFYFSENRNFCSSLCLPFFNCVLIFFLGYILLFVQSYGQKYGILLVLWTCAHAKLLQSCPTLCHPMDSSPSGSSVHGILQARIMMWVTVFSSRGSSWFRDQPPISCIAGRFFTTEPPGKTPLCQCMFIFYKMPTHRTKHPFCVFDSREALLAKQSSYFHFWVNTSHTITWIWVSMTVLCQFSTLLILQIARLLLL